MFAEVGMDAYDYGGDNKWLCMSDTLIAMALNFKFCLCALCCCPRYYGPCFKGHILGRFRKKYNLPSLQCGRGENFDTIILSDDRNNFCMVTQIGTSRRWRARGAFLIAGK
uniref:Uncharacterized protein n=1 Tax=Lotharella globosa TaxID=91324 RepID=A0A7S3YL27_9EUKA